MRNPLLRQAETEIETCLTPETRTGYLRIVVTGMRAALDNGLNGIFASLEQSPDPITDAATLAVSLAIVHRRQPEGLTPLKALVPAAMTLLLQALDFIDQSKVMPIGAPELAGANDVFCETICARFGITKAGRASMGSMVYDLTQDEASALPVLH